MTLKLTVYGKEQYFTVLNNNEQKIFKNSITKFMISVSALFNFVEFSQTELQNEQNYSIELKNFQFRTCLAKASAKKVL